MISYIINSIKSSQGRIIVIYGPRIKYIINQVIDSLIPNLVIFDSPIYYSDRDEVFLLEVNTLHLNNLHETLIQLMPKINYIFFSAFNRFLRMSLRQKSAFTKFRYNAGSKLFLRELKFLLTLTRFNQSSLKLIFLPPARCMCREDVWIILPLFHKVFKLYADLILLVRENCVLQVKPELKSINLQNYSYSEEDFIIKKYLSD